MEAIEAQIGYSFMNILEGVFKHYEPKDAMENLFARQIARAYWRVLLTEVIEERYFASRRGYIGMGKSYDRIIRNERFIDIHLHRAIAAFERKRMSENKNSQNKLVLPEY